MMTAQRKADDLLPFAGAQIPQALRASNRWSPWRATWDVKRGKYDKIPVRADHPELGLSTANPDRWFSFEAALRAHQRAQGSTAGIGYCMTKPHGIIGVDLDGALVDGVVEDWAQEIVLKLKSYTEISPSRRGLRIFVRGELLEDWTNHRIGLEVYSGLTPRFLTVTGAHLPGTPLEVVEAPAGALSWLEDTYRETNEQKIARGEMPPMPLMLHGDDLPDLEDLNLPPRAMEFLTSGEHGGDRSRTLHSTAVALFAAGCSDVEALSILHSNAFAFEVALDHRRQDPDKALDYLWIHHVCAAKGKAASKILTPDDFESWAADYQEPEENAPEKSPAEVADDFEDLGPAEDEPVTRPKLKFAPMQAAEYAALSTSIEWLVPNVLPAGGLSSIYGESGAGKSFWTLDMLVRLAGGLPWWDKTLQPRRIVYVAAEGAVGVRLRLQAIARELQIDLAPLPLYVIAAQPNILDAPDVKELVQAVRSVGGCDLLVLDTLAQVTPGANENDSQDMGKAIKHCQTLQAVLKTAVALIGHSGKDSARGQRGWSGLKGAMDAQIEVIKTATYRAASVTKLKDGQGEGVEYIFQLKNVLLDSDPIEGDTTSCVVEPVLDEAQKATYVAAMQTAKKGGRPKGSAYDGFLIRAAEQLCGQQNAPVAEQRLLDMAEALAKEAADEAGEAPPTRLAYLLKRALVKMGKSEKPDLLHDTDNDTYTLKVPPPPLEFD